ncbi:MAG: hypothetical protein RLZZ08_482 [Pseudomonadota bacterium]|jgi:hypothetical protein
MLMSSAENPATLIYGPSGFRVVRPGHFVICAVSGDRIALEDLRYWSVDRQEAYASADISTKRHLDQA